MRRIGMQLAALALALGSVDGRALGQSGADAGAAEAPASAKKPAATKPAKPGAESGGSESEVAQRAQAAAARAKEAGITAVAQVQTANEQADALKVARTTLAEQRKTFNTAYDAGKLHQRQFDALNAGAKPGATPKGVTHLQKAEYELSRVTASGPNALQAAASIADLEATLAAAGSTARDAATKASEAATEARTAAQALKSRDPQLASAAQEAAREAQTAAKDAKQAAAKAQARAGALGVGKQSSARAGKEASEIKQRLDDAATQLASVRARLVAPEVLAAIKAEAAAANAKPDAKKP